MADSSNPRRKTSRVSNDADPGGALIALMGMTGSGKSSFFNLVSGSAARVGTGLRSCTDNIQLSAPFNVDGRPVILVDTPGFDDTDKSDTETLLMISGYLSASYKDGRKLTGIIYMHRISDVRMDGISTRNFSVFRKLCGTSNFKNVVIVTNFWGEVDSKVANAREKELMGEEIFFKPILNGGGQIMRHDRSMESAQSILRNVLRNSPVVFRIQRQLVEKKMTLVQTDAGSEVVADLQRQEAEHQEEMQTLRSEMEAAVKAKDEITKQELGQALQEAQDHLNRVRASANNLAKGLQDVEAAFAMMASQGYRPIDFNVRLRQVQVYTATTVRKRLEFSLVSITTILESMDGSPQSKEACLARLAKEYESLVKSVSEDIETTTTPVSPQPPQFGPGSEGYTNKINNLQLQAAQEELEVVMKSNEGLQKRVTDLEEQLRRAEIEKTNAVAAEAAKTTREREGRAQALREAKKNEGLLVAAKGEISQLESKLKDEQAKSSELANRLQKQEELIVKLREERGFSDDQRQTEVNQLRTQLQSNVKDIGVLREQSTTLQSKYSDLKKQYELETSSGYNAKVEKERLEAKIISLETAYKYSVTMSAQRESKISALIAQLRTLLESAGTQCNSLQQSYLEHVELNSKAVIKISTEVETRVEEVTVQEVRSASQVTHVSGVPRPALMAFEQGNVRLSKSVKNTAGFPRLPNQ